ncbi:hypothetical protein [Mycoplana rhizolycopersici]|uniref:Uncharacterized protein n=1 Tax=Mycoplana rhizolycopersici TaxID=2746702 RepID=A0ABX2QH06_9HYPH|nr:hypothetical protein [Rhizobium rhizolycopersici]NVP56636.1 hypothetical protein [Rhizobium rhizolycopersici]
MIPPLSQSTGLQVSDQLGKMIEEMEARHKEADDKAKGKDRKDETFGVTSDSPKAVANEKITAYFFGALKGDPDPLATLISRFSSALGITQGKDESSFSFAQRLGDAVSMLGFAKTDSRGEPAVLTLKSLGVSEAEVIDVMQGNSTSKTAPNAVLAARIASQAGLTGEEEDFGARIAETLTAQRAVLPKSVAALEETTGLKKLGLTASDMIAAIANPWSDAGQRVKDALAEQAESESGMSREMRKVIQRLEELADPSTLEELKRGDKGYDPGRVEDEETRAEREETIQDLQNAEKLEDVRDMQEAVGDHIAQRDEDGTSGPASPTDAGLELIEVLAALPDAPSADNDNAELDNAGPGDRPVAETLPAGVVGAGLKAKEEVEDALAVDRFADAEPDLFLPVDDIGIYELLRRRAA